MNFETFATVHPNLVFLIFLATAIPTKGDFYLRLYLRSITYRSYNL